MGKPQPVPVCSQRGPSKLGSGVSPARGLRECLCDVLSGPGGQGSVVPSKVFSLSFPKESSPLGGHPLSSSLAQVCRFRWEPGGRPGWSCHVILPKKEELRVEGGLQGLASQGALLPILALGAHLPAPLPRTGSASLRVCGWRQLALSSRGDPRQVGLSPASSSLLPSRVLQPPRGRLSRASTDRAPGPRPVHARAL